VLGFLFVQYWSLSQALFGTQERHMQLWGLAVMVLTEEGLWDNSLPEDFVEEFPVCTGSSYLEKMRECGGFCGLLWGGELELAVRI